MSCRGVSIPHWFDYSASATNLWHISVPFQFHTGSITADEDRLLSCYISRFQFHTGSITATLMEMERALILYVSIPHWFDYSLCWNLYPWYWRHVSIPHWFDYSCNIYMEWETSCWFQFHTGSITAMVYTGNTLILMPFQFHTGSITAEAALSKIQAKIPCFNSTLVRLQLGWLLGRWKSL